MLPASLLLALIAPASALTLEQSLLSPGHDAVLTATGAPAGAWVQFWSSPLAPGPGWCPGFLQGQCFGIRRPMKYLGAVQADANGTAVLVRAVSPTAPLISVSNQATILVGPQLSNVVTGAFSFGWPPLGVDITPDAARAALTGEAAGDLAGDNVAGGGDVDGDGITDLLVGAKQSAIAGANAGVVYVVSGATVGDLDLGSATARLIGEKPGDYAGGGLADAGDVDGDGYADVLVGAKYEDSGGNGAGAAYVVSGPVSGDLHLGAATAKLTGEHALDLAGGTVGAAGDLDGDGYGDLLVGAKDSDGGGNLSGAVYLVFGPVTGTASLATAAARMDGESAGAHAGSAMSGLGDTDGDGLPDFAVAAGNADAGGIDAGAAYVWTTPPTGPTSLAAAAARILGETGDLLGSLDAAGDVDGDGYADLLVGGMGDADGGVGAGAAWWFPGPFVGDLPVLGAAAKWTGDPGDEAGFTVAGAGDTNGDGAPDAVVGAPGTDLHAGAACLVDGFPAGVWTLHDLCPALRGGPGEELGHATAAVGDPNGDGYADVLIGAHYTDGVGVDSGAAYLLIGGPGW